MLPGIDGYQVCREVRAKANVPIIMLSAKGEIFDKVLGLELGADDYIMKPFDSKELVARVKAVLRRYQPVKVEEPAPELKCVKYPDLIVNLSNYSVIYKDNPIDMPPKELELYISLHPRRTRYLPENSFSITSGVTNTLVTPAPWMSM